MIILFAILGFFTCLRWLFGRCFHSRSSVVRYASIGIVTATASVRWRHIVHRLFRIRRLQRLFGYIGHHLQTVLPVPSTVRAQLLSGF